MADDLHGDQAETGELFPGLPRLPKRGRHYVEPRGHAAPPGSGPEGETCGGCCHAGRMSRGKKQWIKCYLNRTNWTRTRRTDIRARDRACAYWQGSGGRESADR